MSPLALRSNGLDRARSALREVTRDVHERLHGHPAFQRVLDATVDASGYGTLLTRLYGFHKPLEEALHAAPSPGGSVSVRATTGACTG